MSWSWAGCDGNKTTVEVYSDQDKVELLINGKSAGRKKVKECKAFFKVRYSAGTVTAVAYDASGRETGRSELRSADDQFRIAVRPEKTEVNSGEIVYIPVNIEDSNGVVESNADRRITVEVQGGELLAYGSANPCTEEQYHTGSFTTYYGRSLAVVRAGASGTMKVTATDGSMKDIAEIIVK